MSKTQIPTGGIADDAVSEEHLDATAITGSTELAATPADTDEILISDAGTLKRIDFSLIKSVMTPAFSAYVGTLNSVANNTTTVVTGFSERFDSNSKFDTSTGRFTPGETGRYIFYLHARINQASSRFQVLLGKNGSNCPDADGNIESENYGHGSNTYIGVNGFAITECDDVNDYFTMRVWQNSGSSQTFYTNNFMGFKLIT